MELVLLLLEHMPLFQYFSIQRSTLWQKPSTINSISLTYNDFVDRRDKVFREQYTSRGVFGVDGALAGWFVGHFEGLLVSGNWI